MRILLIFLLSLISQCVPAQESGSGTGEIIVGDTMSFLIQNEISWRSLHKDLKEENEKMRVVHESYRNILQVEDQKYKDALMLMYILLDAESESQFNEAVKLIPIVIEEHKIISKIAEDDLDKSLDELYEFYNTKKL